MVDRFKHVRECSKESVQNGEIERYVEREKSNYRLSKKHVDRTKQSNGEQKLELSASIREGRGRRRNAKFLISTTDNCLLVGFSRKDEEDKRENGEEYYRPLCPAPAFTHSDK